MDMDVPLVEDSSFNFYHLRLRYRPPELTDHVPLIPFSPIASPTAVGYAIERLLLRDCNDAKKLRDPFPVKTFQEDKFRFRSASQNLPHVMTRMVGRSIILSLMVGTILSLISGSLMPLMAGSPMLLMAGLFMMDILLMVGLYQIIILLELGSSLRLLLMARFYNRQRCSHADVAHTAEHSMEGKATTKTEMEAALGCNFYIGERLLNGAWKTIITAVGSFFLRRTNDHFARNNRDHECVVPIDPTWLLDSGAFCHSTGKRDILQGLHRCEPNGVRTASGATSTLEECGRVIGAVNLSGVKYFPFSPVNLVSVGLLANKGCDISLSRGQCTIRKDGKVIGKGRQVPEDADEHRVLYILDEFDDSLLEPECTMCPNAHALIR